MTQVPNFVKVLMSKTENIAAFIVDIKFRLISMSAFDYFAVQLNYLIFVDRQLCPPLKGNDTAAQ